MHHKRTNTCRAHERAFTLIEILAYTFVLTLLITTVAYTLIAVNNSYRTLKSSAGLESVAEETLERMTRDIRSATSIDTVYSSFDTSPGQLTLNTLDDAGDATTVQFFLEGQTLRVKEGGVDVGPLSAVNVRITNLVFRRITTPQSQAVKIEVTAESGQDKSRASASFYSTIVLRGSYPTQ